jgi:hypothetical protein
MVLDNRGPLFAGADERVGTLFLWHFVEEIEHRSSALVVQRHITPDPWYRIRRTPKVVRHVAGIYQTVLDGIVEHAGAEARGVDPAVVGPGGLWLTELRARLPGRRRGDPPPTMLGHVPGRELRAMVGRLARTQTPGHDPAREPLPTWADRWHAAYDAGADVATYGGVGL